MVLPAAAVPRAVLHVGDPHLSLLLLGALRRPAHGQVGDVIRTGLYPGEREIRNTHRVPTAQGKQGIWKFCQNTGNLICSSFKFPDPKDKSHFNICRENSQFYLELDNSAK